MAYATQDDFSYHCGGADGMRQLTSTDGGRTADAAVIAKAIANADSVINSYLNKQFLVPLASVPADIKRLSCRLAKFEIRESKGLVDENLIKMHEADLKWLGDVRDGLISIGLDPPPVPASMRVDSSTPRPTSKDVSRKKLAGFS